MKIFLMDTNANKQLLFVEGNLAKAWVKTTVIGIDLNSKDATCKLKKFFKKSYDDGILNDFDDMPGTKCQYQDILKQCRADHDAAELILLFDEDEY